MDSITLYSMPSPSLHLLVESEEDFPFGAKTTSFLPPATVTNAAANTTTITTPAYDLPKWMEDQEFLGLSGLPGDLLSPHPSPTPLGDNLPHLEDDSFLQLEDEYITIKPEDMLVPLSELKPPHTPASPPIISTPPASPPFISSPPASPPLVSPPHVPASPVRPASGPANPPLPKIIICRKVTAPALKNKPVQVQFQVLPAEQEPQPTSDTTVMHLAAHIPARSVETYEQVAAQPVEGSHRQPQASSMALAVPQYVPDIQVSEACDAEELINEMVEMIGDGNNTGGFQDLESISFDPSVMETAMQGLLAQLETTPMDSDQPSSSSEYLPNESCLSASLQSHPPESLSPASISIPYPPESLSPASISIPYPSPSLSPASSAFMPSPVPSVGSLSPPQSSYDSCGEADTDTEHLEEERSPLEETHSYSRSQRKARSSRRASGARKTPYLEDRKERKKEQNKQAALRYRHKKKQEEDELMNKIEVEEERQRKLKATYSSLKQELGYLKKMMREMFVARGMLSEEALKKAALEKKRSSK